MISGGIFSKNRFQWLAIRDEPEIEMPSSKKHNIFSDIFEERLVACFRICQDFFKKDWTAIFFHTVQYNNFLLARIVEL
jgi:hypothetical protein